MPVVVIVGKNLHFQIIYGVVDQVFSWMMESDIVYFPIELGILVVLERFGSVDSSNVVEIAHLVHPVFKSICANLGLVSLGQEGKFVS